MTTLNPMFACADYQQTGRAYVYSTECGSRKHGYYIGHFVCVGGTPRPHTGPLLDKAEAEALRDELNAEAIAVQFVANLRELLNPDEFEEMRATNVHHTDDGICASHDYCDANMPMSAAFESVMGREVFEDHEGSVTECHPQHAADCDLWNRAWEIAKARDLTATPEGETE